jgi:hypothetical protein
MAKRRTSGIQRRSRATEEAMERRLGAGTARALDWRVLTIGAILLLGLLILLLVLMFGGGSGDPSTVGVRQADAGRAHITEGTQGSDYTSVPATSGPHWNSADSPGPWGVYSNAQPQERLIHNLEHGGIVIWYQADQVTAEQIEALETYTRSWNGTERFKVIVSPWSGSDFGHPIAIVAWTWLLYLDEVDTDLMDRFVDQHYGDAPEPGGGPGRPAQ